MEFKWTNNISSQIYEDALSIRKTVFIKEQNVPLELEIDDLEDKCEYVVCYSNSQPVATARLYMMSDYAKVQRVAVLQTNRGLNIGSKMMLEVEKIAKQKGVKQLKLGAQEYAVLFYSKLNYQVCSSRYLDAGIWHKDMMKHI